MLDLGSFSRLRACVLGRTSIPIMCSVRYSGILWLIQTVHASSQPLAALQIPRFDCLKAHGDLYHYAWQLFVLYINFSSPHECTRGGSGLMRNTHEAVCLLQDSHCLSSSEVKVFCYAIYASQFCRISFARDVKQIFKIFWGAFMPYLTALGIFGTSSCYDVG